MVGRRMIRPDNQDRNQVFFYQIADNINYFNQLIKLNQSLKLSDKCSGVEKKYLSPQCSGVEI